MHGLETKYGNCVDFVYLDIDSAATKAAKDKLGYVAQPNFFLLDASGKIVWKKLGLVTEAELDQQLKAITKP